MQFNVKLANTHPDKTCDQMQPGEWGIITSGPAGIGIVVKIGDPVFCPWSGAGEVEFPTRDCHASRPDQYHYRPLQPGDVITISG